MKKRIELSDKQQCSGCHACADGCPIGCIQMQEDTEGFLYPRIDHSKCTECGKCLRICPNITIPVSSEMPDKSYAVISKDAQIRKNGSSGGVFETLSHEILRKNGKVWGAAFNDKLELFHVAATDQAGIRKLCKSKYIQSNLTEVYKNIYTDLKNNILTLFVGTPCQVAALKNYLKRDYPHLYLVDFVCHGVPSQKLFSTTIKWYEKKKRVKVTDFSFRHKSNRINNTRGYSIKGVKKGKKIEEEGLHYKFPFYFGFHKYITLRPSCYACSYAQPKRCSDLTLGDFWGVEKHINIDHESGVSLILANTDKGRYLLKEIDSGIIRHTLTLEAAKGNNPCLSAPTKEKPEREELFRALQNEPFPVVVKRHLTPKRVWVFNIYYGMPTFIRNFVLKIMKGRMKYE